MRTIIYSIDDDGIVIDLQFLQQIKNLPDGSVLIVTDTGVPKASVAGKIHDLVSSAGARGERF